LIFIQVNQPQATTSKTTIQSPKATKDINTVQKTIISKPAIHQSVQQSGQMDGGNKSTTVVIRNPSTKQQIGTKIVPQKQIVQKVLLLGIFRGQRVRTTKLAFFKTFFQSKF
jgi:hypothetical protein